MAEDVDAHPNSIAGQLIAAYDAWFADLQKLSNSKLDPDDWTGRWYDGFSPADALAEGPDDD